MRIGILGGTFNPIHNGHLLIAENAYTQFHLDQILFLPAGIPPHKRNLGILDGETRKEIISCAIKNVPYFAIDEREIHSEKVSYTYLTLTDMKNEHPENEYFFIMGADSLAYFKEWIHPDIILQKATVLAAVRDNQDMEVLHKYKEEILKLFPGKIDFIITPEFNVSSHDIRKRVQNKESIRYLTPDSVCAYIEEHQLYQ